MHPLLSVDPVAIAESAKYRHPCRDETWSNTIDGLELRTTPHPETEAPASFALAFDTELEPVLAGDRRSIAFLFEGQPVVRLAIPSPKRDELTLRLEPDRIVISPTGEPENDFEDRATNAPLVVLTGDTSPGDSNVVSTTPNWTVESNRDGATLGASLATAGDVNGDRFSDVIVGAPRFDAGRFDEGRAFVYLGSAKGLSSSPAWSVTGGQDGALLGGVVAPAGDLNGDGYADVVVTADSYPGSFGVMGRVLVYLGSNSGLSTTADWTADGTEPGARFGFSAASAGDIDGDGYDDLIVGAPFSDAVMADEGRAFVYVGSAGGLSTSAAWTIDGTLDNQQLGASVASAGDVNGDGFGDVVIGSPGFDFDRGLAAIHAGSAMGLSSSPLWTGEGDSFSSGFGTSVALAGDLDGDGFGDVIVGAPTPLSRGQAHVFLGGADEVVEGPTLECDQTNARFGFSVAPAGDVNGDGYADVVIGAPRFDDDEEDEGRAFVYLGSAEGLGAEPVWTANGNQADAHFGESVATGGDVNGDGLSDTLVGAPQFSNGQAQEGRAFAYLGSTSPPSLTPGWTAQGTHLLSRFGNTVAAAGDVNGDGFSDVIVGARSYNGGQPSEGRARVYFGSAEGLSTEPAWTAESNQADARFGESVASAGDVNGDGYADVIIGAPGFWTEAGRTGRAFVFFGPLDDEGDAADWTADGLTDDAGFASSVSAAGDIDGDGFGDVIVGAPGPVSGLAATGSVTVFRGSPSGISKVPSWNYTNADATGRLGESVSTAGDVNGDGFGDVIVGVPSDRFENTRGRALVFLGSPTGLSTEPTWRATAQDTRTLFGRSVAAAGDVNGDGFSDVIVGEESFSDVKTNAGRALLFLGSAAGIANAPAWIVEADQAEALFGSSVASAGDVNADGFSDLIVGSSEFDAPSDNGRAEIFLGGPHGPGTNAAWSVTGAQSTSLFGGSVARAGDVNGDGADDVIVGAEQGGMIFNGEVRLFFGNDGAGRAWPAEQRWVRARRPVATLGKSDSSSSFRIRATSGTAAGRAAVALEWEVAVAGTGYGSATIVTEVPRDTGLPGASGSQLTQTTVATGLDEACFYHWRTRYVSDSPFFPRSIWRSVPRAGLTETALRTAGTLPPTPFAVVGPTPNERIFPDSEPLSFTWSRGGGQRFLLEWSRNPEFEIALETSPEIDAIGSSEIQVYTPTEELWQQVLQLAAGNPDIRDVPIFWRLVSLDTPPVVTGGRELLVLRMAAAIAPTLVSPPDAAEFLTIQPPTLTWNANHNERFRVVFAGNDFLGGPRVASGDDYDLSGPEWDVPDEIWAQVVVLSQGSGGTIYYAVFARDALDRVTWSRTRSLRVLGNKSRTE